MATKYINQVGYGLTNALPNLAPYPIQAKRAPTTADTGYAIGTIWVEPALNAVYILASVVNSQAEWVSVSGGSGDFTSLTVNPGPTNITGLTNINVNGTGNTNIGSGTNSGDVTIGNAADNGFVDIVSPALALDSAAAGLISIGASLTTGSISIGSNEMTTGLITIGSTTQTGLGYISLGISDATNTVFIASGTGNSTVNIANAASAHNTVAIASAATISTVTIGSTTSSSTTTINGGTGGIVHDAPFTALPGPVYIYTGSGAPNNALALHTGDLYINTTAATTTTRLYIATGAGAWTYFTTNA